MIWNDLLKAGFIPPFLVIIGSLKRKYCMNKTLITFIVIILLAGTAFADNKESINNIFGVKLGLFGGGNIDVDGTDGYEYEFDTESGFKGGIFWDHRLTNRIFIGLSADATEIEPFMKKKLLIGISAITKIEMLQDNDQLSIKPGFGVGYALLGEIKSGSYSIENSNYFTVIAFL